MAVPANVSLSYVVQDNRGFKAQVRFEMFIADASASATPVSDIITGASAVGAALRAMSNAKVVQNGFGIDYIYAQEPTSESGTYQLVQQKARLEGGDGRGGFMSAQVPAPKDAIFLTTASEKLIVVDPAATTLVALQAALNSAGAGIFPTARGGSSFAEFFGGQLIEGKPRRRRVLQGA